MAETRHLAAAAHSEEWQQPDSMAVFLHLTFCLSLQLIDFLDFSFCVTWFIFSSMSLFRSSRVSRIEPFWTRGFIMHLMHVLRLRLVVLRCKGLPSRWRTVRSSIQLSFINHSLIVRGTEDSLDIIIARGTICGPDHRCTVFTGQSILLHEEVAQDVWGKMGLGFKLTLLQHTKHLLHLPV